MDNSPMHAYRILGAIRFIRSHGIDAWPTDDSTMVLAMAESVETRPSGPIVRREPILLATTRREVMGWLGY